MKRNYYLFNPGRLSRKDDSLKFTPVNEAGEEQKPRYIPVNGVEDLFCFGSLDANSAMYNFLGKHHINVHFFDYYEHYTGSFMAKDYLLAGKVVVNQTLHYHYEPRRLSIAKRILDGASFNMLKNLRYYATRGREVQQNIDGIEHLRESLPKAEHIEVLMGIEGNIRQTYYGAFDEIINDFSMGTRQKRPPNNEVNTLISFGNMLCYTACLGAIYHTQLNPTISYLHEPGARRFSLALDLAEIFKPVLIDRLIFRVLNKKQIQEKHFDQHGPAFTLRQNGRKVFVKAWEDRLKETIQHRKLNRKVSYKRLMRLECYKLSKHILEIETYQPFKAWW